MNTQEKRRRLPRLLVSAKTAARLIGVDVETWRRWDAAGRVPAAVRISKGCTRWRLAELRRWVADGCPRRLSMRPAPGGPR